MLQGSSNFPFINVLHQYYTDDDVWDSLLFSDSLVTTSQTGRVSTLPTNIIQYSQYPVQHVCISLIRVDEMKTCACGLICFFAQMLWKQLSFIYVQQGTVTLWNFNLCKVACPATLWWETVLSVSDITGNIYLSSFPIWALEGQ